MDVVSAGSKISRTVSAEAKYDGQSLQEAKISGLVYTLCYLHHCLIRMNGQHWYNVYPKLSWEDDGRLDNVG